MFGKPATDGERLRAYLVDEVLGNVDWTRLRQDLGTTGRANGYTEFVRHFTASHLAVRLVLVARGVFRRVESEIRAEQDDPEAYVATTEPVVSEELRRYLDDVSEIPASLHDDVERLTLRAVDASREKVGKGRKKAFRRWAEVHHPHCFICGTPLDFVDRNSLVAYTLEHIWPQHLGGNSEGTNLLPACSSCNSRKKKDAVSWTSPPVLALGLRPDPSADRLREIDGSIKFALLYRAAQSLADRQRLTLKEAFLALGPWTDPRAIDPLDATDFFNVENYNTDALL